MDPIDVGTWLKLFGPDDVGAMIGVGLFAGILYRAQAINEQWSMLLPLFVGALLGLLQSWSAGYAPAAFAIKGIMLGGGSGVIGRLVSMGLDKSGLFPVKPPDLKGP